MPWDLVASSVGGAAVTLVGVFAGAVLSSRGQKQHWSRDKQIDACAGVLAESTRMQLALHGAWKHGDSLDWVAWNQALAHVWLVGVPEVVAAAAAMDDVFWRQSYHVARGGIPDETSWAASRDLMESARLDFINAARAHVVKAGSSMRSVPVSRPPLSELAE